MKNRLNFCALGACGLALVGLSACAGTVVLTGKDDSGGTGGRTAVAGSSGATIGAGGTYDDTSSVGGRSEHGGYGGYGGRGGTGGVVVTSDPAGAGGAIDEVGGAGGAVGQAGEAGVLVTVLQPGSEGKDAQVGIVAEHPETQVRNYGSAQWMITSAWTYYGGLPVHLRSFIEFDLSSLPPAATIESATLTLFAAPQADPSDPFAGHSALSGPNDFWIESVNAAWAEDMITWENQPKTAWNAWGAAAPVGGVHHVPTTSYDEDVSVDITPLVQKALKNPAAYHGFMIHLNTEDYYRNLRFATSDHENPALHPKLEVHFSR